MHICICIYTYIYIYISNTYTTNLSRTPFLKKLAANTATSWAVKTSGAITNVCVTKCCTNSRLCRRAIATTGTSRVSGGAGAVEAGVKAGVVVVGAAEEEEEEKEEEDCTVPSAG